MDDDQMIRLKPNLIFGFDATDDTLFGALLETFPVFKAVSEAPARRESGS